MTTKAGVQKVWIEAELIPRLPTGFVSCSFCSRVITNPKKALWIAVKAKWVPFDRKISSDIEQRRYLETICSNCAQELIARSKELETK